MDRHETLHHHNLIVLSRSPWTCRSPDGIFIPICQCWTEESQIPHFSHSVSSVECKSHTEVDKVCCCRPPVIISTLVERGNRRISQIAVYEAYSANGCSSEKHPPQEPATSISKSQLCRLSSLARKLRAFVTRVELYALVLFRIRPIFSGFAIIDSTLLLHNRGRRSIYVLESIKRYLAPSRLNGLFDS